MRRFVLLLPLAAMPLAGCNTTYKEEREGWDRTQWTAAVKEDQSRLLREEVREKPTWPALKKVNDTISDQMVRIWNAMTGNTPFDAAKGLLDPYVPDRRRQAVMYFSKHDYGRQNPYVKYYAEMARNDDDYTVRAMAIRALNRCRAKEYTSLYMQALDDKNELVRLEGAKALANIPEPLAETALLKHLDDGEESVDVRVACADALRSYRTLTVAEAMIRMLRDREFAVSWQARWTLKLMTGHDFLYDQAAWRSYLTASEKPFG